VFSLTCFSQRCGVFAVGQKPRPSIPRVWAVAAVVFRWSFIQIELRANVELTRGLALENVRSWHCQDMVAKRRLELLTFPACREGLCFPFNRNLVGTRRLELLTSTVSR
jgi:hypothetical protein